MDSTEDEDHSAIDASYQTYASLCTSLTSFLTVAIHTLLYTRACYPASSFLLASAYGYPVRQSRHPAVCKWITDAVEAVHVELLAGTLASVSLVICDARTAAPLERFVFDLSRLPQIPAEDADALITRDSDDEGSSVAETENVDVIESLRGVLAKIVTLNARLLPVPPGCPFTLAIGLRNDTEVDPPLDHPQPWIPARPRLPKTRLDHSKNGDQTQGNTGRPLRLGKDLGGTKTIPIRSVDAGELVFEMWAEEGIAKSKIMARTASKLQQSKAGTSKTLNGTAGKQPSSKTGKSKTADGAASKPQPSRVEKLRNGDRTAGKPLASMVKRAKTETK